MKVAPGGEKLAVAMQEAGLVQVFDFNDSTGVISNPVTLPGVVSAYGIEFSRDTRFLSVHLPNAFTPDGNGINDLFMAKATYDVNIRFIMHVFNRWGETVFESTDISKGWDGNFRGIPCPTDVYIWTADVDPEEVNAFFTGPFRQSCNVTLIR